MHLKSVTSCPLIQSPNSGLWVPDESRRQILPIGRRRFLKLAGATAIGFAGATAINSFFPKRADAQWYQLIPIILAGIELSEHLYNWGEELGLFPSLSNESPQPQLGNLGIRLVSYTDRPTGLAFYQDSQWIDAIPPYTQRTYNFASPSGPYGQNAAFAATGYNTLSQAYSVV